MKYKFVVLALAISIPSVVWAGVSFFNTDPVYVISNNDRELTPVPVIKNFRLKWNDAVGKFDLLPGHERSPINIENAPHPIQMAPQPDEPIYYGDDFLI